MISRIDSSAKTGYSPYTTNTAKAHPYSYKPLRFFVVAFALTWLFWGIAIFLGQTGASEEAFMVFMLLGLLVPAVVSFCTVMLSGSAALKKDYHRKLFRLKDLSLPGIVIPIAIMLLVIVVSISLSLLVGESTNQFSFVGGFSFSIGSMPTLLTLIVAALLEELGWRGYAEDALANGTIWLKASLIFGVLWSLWHVPLLFIPGTYHSEILAMNPLFAVNFFVSVIPMALMFTWVYVQNKRSILGCAIFHFFANFLQEQIAMTQVTKCIESVVMLVVVVIIIAANKKLFFDRGHIGNLLNEPKDL